MIISDYGHGVVNDEGAKRLIQRAKKEIPVIYDPKLTGLHRTHEVDWVIFQSRGLELVRRRINAEDSADCARKLLDEYHWGHLMVLGGADGVTVYTNDDISHALHPHKPPSSDWVNRCSMHCRSLCCLSWNRYI